MTVNLIMSRTAMVNKTLPTTMWANKMSTVTLAKKMDYSQPLISKLRTGKAKLQFEQIEPLLEALPKQSGYLLIDILHQVSGGLIPSTVDSKYIFLNASSMDNRVIEEAQQAIKAITDSLDEFGSPVSVVKDLHDPEEAFNQMFDLIKYGLMLEIVIGDYLGWDTADIQARCLQREAYLKRHKYQIV